MENGSHGDVVEQNCKNGKTNGSAANGDSHKEEDEDGIMDTKEADAMKSPSAPKGKGGRKSKSDFEPKSE